MADRWKYLFSFLKGKGFEVYAPSQKVGDCTSNYVVLKSGEYISLTGSKSGVKYYDIYVYVPANKYSQLEEYKSKVKEAMKTLFPEFKDTMQDTSSIEDEGAKAHVVRMTYNNYSKISNL